MENDHAPRTQRLTILTYPNPDGDTPDPNRPEYGADWQAFGSYRRWGQQPDADGMARADTRQHAVAMALHTALTALQLPPAVIGELLIFYTQEADHQRQQDLTEAHIGQ